MRNKMTKLIMLKGLPASGKSSWSLEQIKKGGYVRVSVDDIRNNVYGGWSQKRESNVLRMRNAMIREGLEQGRNVIVDATNLNPKHEKCLREIADEMGVKFEINDSFLDITPEECIERDLHRGEKAVGAGVIWEMYYKYLSPKVDNLLVNKDKPRCIICDLDGTLSLNTSGRSFYDMDRVGEDSLDPFVGCIVDALYNYGIERDGSPYPRIILVSGRSECARKATEEWLDRNMIPYDDLFMRKDNDNRKDADIKEEIYHTLIEPKYAVLGVLDDRNSVSRRWRQLGLRVAQLGFPELEF